MTDTPASTPKAKKADMKVAEAERRITAEIHHLSTNIHRELRLLRSIMSTQDNINADVTALTASAQQIQDGMTAIEAEIAALQGQGVDVSGLTAAVASVSDAAARVSADVPPAPPAP